MRNFVYCVLFLVLSLWLIGCMNEPKSSKHPNLPPVTYFWLFPDSTLSPGISKERIRWWGEDGDGTVVGYLFASGKFLTASKQLPQPDTIAWTWTTKTDTFLAFPLLKQRDTFDLAIKAVDNTFHPLWPDSVHPSIRLSPFPYWDVDTNGRFNAGDIELPLLTGAMDPKGAVQPMPIVNQPPTVVFAQDPNDPTVQMQQPDTTFTVATFSWVGTDPDGDQTIKQYEFVLNDTSKTARWDTVPSGINLITLVVPRVRSDSGQTVATADVYSGTFYARRHIGSLPGMRLNNFNKFFLRARDIADSSSTVISMPDTTVTPGKKWFVKSPKGRLLIVGDYTNSSSSAGAVRAFYGNLFSRVSGGGFVNYDFIDIARGLTADDRSSYKGKVGKLVPPFIDPAFVLTLHLFDVVFWYSDQFPSLAVGQFPLFEYTHDLAHRGKVIFTTMFAMNIDPRGALKDFAPIDSVSSVLLPSSGRAYPALGDNNLNRYSWVYPDSSDASDIYPPLQAYSTVIGGNPYAAYVRPVYKRADARYIYRIQDDTLSQFPRYSYLLTLNEILSVSAVNNQAWACNSGGEIFHTTDRGQSWVLQSSGTSNSINAIQFLDANNGWAVGQKTSILQTNDGGATWNYQSLHNDATDFNGEFFTSVDAGVIVGTNGAVVRTTDGGASWSPSIGVTSQDLNAVFFLDQNRGIAVGDTGTVVMTRDGGVSWQASQTGVINNLNSVWMLDTSNIIAVGQYTSANNVKTNCIRTTDGGRTWHSFTVGNAEWRSIHFTDRNNGWVCGAGLVGSGGCPSCNLYRTADGGLTWGSPVVSHVTQNLDRILFTSASEGWAAGGSLTTVPTYGTGPGGGVILHTEDGGSTWEIVPHGNINIGVIDGEKRFVLLGLPLHYLCGDPTATTALQFLEHVLHHEFGF